MSNKKKSTEKRWFLPNPDGINEALGPYTLDEIENKIKSEELKLDSFIWDVALSEKRWHRLYELSAFNTQMQNYPKAPLPKKMSAGQSSQVIKVNFDHTTKEGEYGVENEYRRYPRAPMKAKAIIHNQKIFDEAECIDISEKGMFLSVKNPEIFSKGEEVTVTIIENSFFKTLSIPSVIMKVLNKDKMKGHGLYFLRLNPQTRRKIAEYVVQTLNEKSIEEKQSA